MECKITVIAQMTIGEKPRETAAMSAKGLLEL